jgi:hypothetical protein
MNSRHKDEWLRDIEARQRNIVFPDTAENEGRFWRNIISGKRSLTLAQWIGISLLWVCMIALLTTFWPKGDEPWWRKLIDGYTVIMVLIAGLVAFIVVGNRRASRKARRQ